MSALADHILFKKYRKVCELCQPLKKLRISGFIYMRRYPDGRFIDLSNQINWTSFFLEKYLEQQYPVEMIANHMLADRGSLLWCTEPENLVWKEGVDLFGLGNGISIYKKREHYCEIFCFYGQATDSSLNIVFARYYILLEKFLKYFIENMGSDIQIAYEKHDVLLTPNAYLNINKEPASNINELEFLKEIKKEDTILSPREIECISLCSSGKTAKEIARYINISHRTVETYLANAKKKLGCRNLKELLYAYSFQ